jgi:hypothetical protein
MSVDINKIEVGDKVTLVPLEVMEIHPTTVKLKSGGGPTYATADMITGHHRKPKEIKVGSRVRVQLPGVRGTVQHILQDRAWVRWDAGYHTVWKVSELTLVTDDQ